VKLEFLLVRNQFLISTNGDSGHKTCEQHIIKEQMWVWHLLVQRNVVSENDFSMS